MARKDITDKQVCLAVLNRGDWFSYEVLRAMTGQPDKVCYSALERALKHGLIEYGVSLRTGWLTEKGRQLLETRVTVDD